MGALNSRILTVDPNAKNNENTFATIQEAVDNSDLNTLIILTPGEHIGGLQLRPRLHFYGMPGAKIVNIGPQVYSSNRCPKECEMTCGEYDVIFENINFINTNNDGFKFGGMNLLFKSCQFYINIDGQLLNRRDSDLRMGFRLESGSVVFQNPLFCAHVEELCVFILFGSDEGVTNVSFQNPTIRIYYKNVEKLETFFFRGLVDTPCVPVFESFSASIHYETKPKNAHKYDGHCCAKNVRKCKKKHCNKCEDNKRCKYEHRCCDKKCQRNKSPPADIRLFRSVDCVTSTLNSTKIYFIEGKGNFNIAAGNSITYINGLTAISNTSKFEMGNFRKILLTGFMSNLKDSCEIKDKHCIETCPPDSDSSDSEGEHPCPSPCPPPCPPPCPLPCPLPIPFPCPPPCPCPQSLPQPLPCPQPIPLDLSISNQPFYSKNQTGKKSRSSYQVSDDSARYYN